MIQSLASDAATDSRNVLATICGAQEGETKQLTQRVGASAEFALRDGNWKLIVGNDAKSKLFDLSSDLGETTDVSDQHPERTRAMGARISQIIEPAKP